MPNITPGLRTTEFYTTLMSQIVGVLLAAGAITQTQAGAANSAAPIIGGILVFLVPTLLYTATRFGLKWRFGAVPLLPSAASGPTDLAPATSGPVSPGFSPPSTGSGAPFVLPADFPVEAV